MNTTPKEQAHRTAADSALHTAEAYEKAHSRADLLPHAQRHELWSKAQEHRTEATRQLALAAKEHHENEADALEAEAAKGDQTTNFWADLKEAARVHRRAALRAASQAANPTNFQPHRNPAIA